MAQLAESGIEYVYETDASSGANEVPTSENIANDGKSVLDDSKANPFNQLTEYELTPSDPKETLEQKLQNLWLEIVEFQEEVEAVKDKTKSDEPAQQTLSDVGDLLKKLDALKALSGDVTTKVNLTDPQGTLYKKLLSDMEKLNKKKVDEGSTNEEETKIDYQLFYPTNDTKADRMSKISSLEKRLSRLDQVMGKIPEIPTPLIIEAANKSLLETVSNLVNKSKSLESQNWMDVENKAGMVLKRMDQISDKRDSLEQKAKMDKISELYHIMMKWQKLSSTLPQVVDRLTRLKTLHEQSLEFKQLLGHLEVTQQQIGVQLKGHGELLKSVQNDIAKNLSTIKTNCDNIQEKLKNVGK